MSDRIVKVNNLIKQALAEIINEEIELPSGTLVTVTGVVTSNDLHYAKVYVSILPETSQDEVLKVLRKEVKNFHHLLNQKVVLRHIPKLRFYINDQEAQAADIDYLLDNLQY